MPDTFEWPDQATLQDEQSFRMWLIQVLSRIHVLSAETARLQAVANGRVSKVETTVAEYPPAKTMITMAADLPMITVKLTMVERLVFGAAGLILTGFVGALLILVWKR